MNNTKFKLILSSLNKYVSDIDAKQKEKCKKLVTVARTEEEAIAIAHGYNLGRESMFKLLEVIVEILKQLKGEEE